jgi:hypothetical protein
MFIALCITIEFLVFLLVLLEADWMIRNCVTPEELYKIRLYEKIGKPISLCELRRRKA